LEFRTDFAVAEQNFAKAEGRIADPSASLGMTIHPWKLYLTFPNKIVIPTGAGVLAQGLKALTILPVPGTTKVVP
jgi:hypothetical protein